MLQAHCEVFMSSVDLRCRVPGQGTRLNVVLPGLAQNVAFGGMSSALELTGHLAQHYDACRFISLLEEHVPAGRPGPFDHLWKYAREPEIFFARGNKLACHEKDVFLITYWAGFPFWEDLHRARRGQGLAALPFYYFIQDYEPGFAPLGQKHAMALKTYSFGKMTRAVINSRELAAHLKKNGWHFAAEYVLQPSLNRDIARFLRQTGFNLPPKGGDRTIILFYGRPGVPRNCFEAGVETLRLFFAELPAPGRDKFAAVSVGLAHEDIPLAEGAVLKSRGRLPVEEYIALLLKAHVGLSLMISPHPSYPPLEMALFGMPTVTTDYDGKKMGGTHPLLASAPWPDPGDMLVLLRQAAAQAAKLKNTAQRAVLPTSLSRTDWPENFASLRIEPIVP